MSELLAKAAKAKGSAQGLGVKTTEQKNAALHIIADQLISEIHFIMGENEKDIENAKQKGFQASLIDRLVLNTQRIQDMADALKQQAELNDPIGDVLESWDRPNDLAIEKVSVPLGVVGMIYEARPNVTVDAASLCLKTGNAVLLRGSSSAAHSNKALVDVIHRALEQSDLPADAVQLLEDTSRETASKMFKLNDYLDVLIPRGGNNLIQTVVEQSSVPVLETGSGNCHVFIDESADKQMAIDIAVNAKTQRPSVCNAAETVIVHVAWAKKHLPELIQALQHHDVEVRGDDKAQALAENLIPATEEDWATEFLDKTLAVKIVPYAQAAIEHINQYGTSHSEAIITESDDNMLAFFNNVDAAALYHNASTRFTDGFEFGFGAEIGISTQKLHARGPMGLPALTSTKYIIRGKGQIKA
ncbi:glutamate-5-semialdehyde dehydrogenase [Lentibacillus cibarius]|uniref:Gamma-glutamyl phosphate reductase n=1 Tax=Lentibacillus cibarius TaxID=2583219 RepID=A0A549YFE9_9BACI|nr:glutamate-5-semialdehyde dehydrogenase [Lentibacillus cibarius]TRM10606.1 glutamate-5-semialdehyde dehydrogenase [Lentibacillus cibarius]